MAFGLGPSNPPALLAALAERAAAKDIEELHLYYQIAAEGAKPLFERISSIVCAFTPTF
jgi:hypothetical protein